MSVQPPPPEVVLRFQAPVLSFINLLIPAAVYSGLQVQEITSWYRDPLRNAAVGGDADSQHLIGAAMDVDGPHAEAFASLWGQFGGVSVNEGDHFHVQVYPKGIGPRLRY